MKIFLIGKNGQLGHEIEKLSLKNNYKISSFGKDELDILNYKDVKKKILRLKPDVVINTAAMHVVPDCETDPIKAFQINSFAQKNIAEICNENNIKSVYISTDKVFDGTKKTPYSETDRPNPIQNYGLSKLAGEFLTLNNNKNSLVIRTSIIFGGLAGSRQKKGNFVLYILNKAKEEKRLEISSEQITSFVYADDLAKSILGLVKKKKNGIYNVSNQKHSSSAIFAKEIIKIRSLDLKIIPVDRGGFYGQMRTPIFTALSTSKLKSAGITLPDWQTSLKCYLKYLESNGI